MQPYDFFFLTPPSHMSEDDDLLRDEGLGEERWAMVGIMVVDEDSVEGNDSIGMEQQLQPNQYNIPAYKLSYIYNSSSLLNKYKCRFDSQKQL